MSFFGLTSFGPESVLRSNFKSNDGIKSFNNEIKSAFELFKDEEFKSGFEKCISENKSGDKLKLEFTKQFLQYSLKIPPLVSEVEGILYKINVFINFISLY